MKQRDFSIRGYQVETQEGYEWIVEYPDLPGVAGGGDSFEEAFKEADVNRQFYFAYLHEHNLPEPVPATVVDESATNGRVTFRMSKTLHKRAVERAQAEGVSLNNVIAEALTVYLDRQDARSFFAETTPMLFEKAGVYTTLPSGKKRSGPR